MEPLAERAPVGPVGGAAPPPVDDHADRRAGEERRRALTRVLQ